MSNESLRRELLTLPPEPVPEIVAANIRVNASHECDRRSRRSRLWERWSLSFQNLWKPLAVPAAGGLLSSVLLFGSMVDTLNVGRYLRNDVPLGIFTQVSVDELSPFAASGADVTVEVTIDEQGRVSNFSVPSGKLTKDQLRRIGSLILYSTFTPATAYGQPVSGKILVALHHINVKG